MTTTGGSSGPTGVPPVGALADEAAQLLDALAVRLAQVRVTVGAHDGVSTQDAAAGHDSRAPGPAAQDPDAQDSGAQADGAQADGAQADGAQADGAQADGAQDPAAQASAAHGATGPADDRPQCVGWCPVCRSADLLRGDRPEVAGKLIDSAIVVVNALRSLLPATPAAGPPSPGDPGPPPPQPGIERIDIR